MAKGNNTSENENRGKLTCKCPTCKGDMELIKNMGMGPLGMYLVCSCGNRIKYTRGLYKEFTYYRKR